MGPRVVPRISPFDLGWLQLVPLGSDHLPGGTCGTLWLLLWICPWAPHWLQVAPSSGGQHPPAPGGTRHCFTCWGFI